MVFNALLELSRLNSFKICLFRMNRGTQHCLGCIIVLKLLELKTIVMRLKLSAKLHFKGY